LCRASAARPAKTPFVVGTLLLRSCVRHDAPRTASITPIEKTQSLSSRARGRGEKPRQCRIHKGEDEVPALLRKRDDKQWAAETLPEPPSTLRLGRAPSAAGEAPVAAPPPAGVIVRATGHAAPGASWALLVDPGARVLHNGQPVAAGVRVLAHRDALALEGGGEVAFFSTEEPARVEPFAGADAVTCPRCRGAIEPGTDSVRCPACGVLHHESEELGCWTYAQTCALCAQPTALDAGLQWTPEGL
jgi:hypothetical protein